MQKAATGDTTKATDSATTYKDQQQLLTVTATGVNNRLTATDDSQYWQSQQCMMCDNSDVNEQ